MLQILKYYIIYYILDIRKFTIHKITYVSVKNSFDDKYFLKIMVDD